MKGFSLALAVFLVVFAASCGSPAESEEKLLVAAAADLIPAFKELGTGFERATGIKVTFTFSSTGILARQVVVSGGQFMGYVQRRLTSGPDPLRETHKNPSCVEVFSYVVYDCPYNESAEIAG